MRRATVYSRPSILAWKGDLATLNKTLLGCGGEGEEERGWGEEEVGERQVASATSLSPYLPLGATETARLPSYAPNGAKQL
ncbi:hypothetical protein PPACK8108_LOCUS22910 [Phakopsora pachyrhizi]|uniref:Uncharacterized protein n=1 Tax=Phakopsora pachyrhizi TaxID=170000 RepID=A0AAV0BMS0_PHAPC|nr:hypothetical protein PPACK8108_LOCUS22910 [Phakopsora pachyrhizi]